MAGIFGRCACVCFVLGNSGERHYLSDFVPCPDASQIAPFMA